MPRQIQGSQRDFSFGEVDVDLKRADEHPARKGGLRQMVNARIRNSGTVQNRSGRRALYPTSGVWRRTERFTLSVGNDFDIQFSAGGVRFISSAGAGAASFTTQGNGAALPWASADDINSIVYAIIGLSIYITFGHSMVPQVVSWNGASTWSIADYAEQVIGGSQKRTPFYRVSPQGITLLPSAQTGNITLAASQALFTPAWVGARIRYVGRQVLITGFTDSQNVNATVKESLPGSQVIGFATDPMLAYAVGDVVIGSVSGSKGQVVSFPGGNTIKVQLLSTSTSVVGAASGLPSVGGATTTLAFVVADYIAGPGGTVGASSVAAVGAPEAVTIWDDEVMNALNGYPASVFADQFRLGFCDFKSVPGGICWSAINTPADLYVGANPNSSIFEITPDKVRVLYVLAGPESSEFVFCNRKLYYIKIDASNPLKPGSVGFQTLSGDGCAQVQPRASQEVLLYVNAGGNSMMAIVASGAYYRPFNTKNLSDFHAHLFSDIIAIAAPTADGTFNERYAYVLNRNGALVVGKYNLQDVTSDTPKVGWGPWSGSGAVSWVAAWAADVLFTSTYLNATVVEVLDDNQYLDAAIMVNAPLTPFSPPGPSDGPLWWRPGGTVSLMDQVTRSMGTYDVDSHGVIVPQNNGGEDLTSASLVAGQPWTMVVEPFAPDAQSGADMQQRMNMRQIANLAVYVINSTGFMLASLFSAKQTRTSPPLGTVMNQRRVPAWNQDDDATKPPLLRETVEAWSPSGSSFDPRAAIIKDTPGPLLIAEIGMEITL